MKINTTLIVQDHSVTSLEDWLRANFEVIDYKVLPDTEYLYKNDKHFKKLVDMKKKINREIGEYINLKK